MRNQQGFTLVEIIIALAVSLVMLLAVYGVVNLSQWTSRSVERKVVAQQDAKAALELMEMEIRMASYNPTFNETLWIDSACNELIPDQQVRKGIIEATANSLTIAMDINEDGVIDATNEIIRYEYHCPNPASNCDPYISRATINGSNCGSSGQQPFLGAKVSSGVPRGVKVINSQYAKMPVFRYMGAPPNQMFQEIQPWTNPGVLIPLIRLVQITLVVETEFDDPTTKKPKKLSYSTVVVLRNHAPDL